MRCIAVLCSKPFENSIAPHTTEDRYKTFRIVTSIAKAGGSARPLHIVRYFGDAPLELLARQVDRLSYVKSR